MKHEGAVLGASPRAQTLPIAHVELPLRPAGAHKEKAAANTAAFTSDILLIEAELRHWLVLPFDGAGTSADLAVASTLIACAASRLPFSLATSAAV